VNDQPVRPLMVEALLLLDFTQPLSPDDKELLFNSTAAERAVVARQHADAAVLLDRRARALMYAGTVLRQWWDSPGATLRTALDEAPRELGETVANRLREVGFAVDPPPAEDEP
jgi:hypothetical protein